jgi:hypothetical protein
MCPGSAGPFRNGRSPRLIPAAAVIVAKHPDRGHRDRIQPARGRSGSGYPTNRGHGENGSTGSASSSNPRRTPPSPRPLPTTSNASLIVIRSAAQR